MTNITCKFVETEAEKEGVRGIRRTVFVEEQGIPEPMVFADESTGDTFLAAAMDGDRVIGTGRFVIPEAGKAKIERMAVLKEYRSRGAGRIIVEFLLDHIREHDVQQVFLHAQHTAISFYQTCDFRESGPHFQEVGIDHVEMVLDL